MNTDGVGMWHGVKQIFTMPVNFPTKLATYNSAYMPSTA